MPQTFHTRGNIELLSQNFVAVYGSRQASEALKDDVALLARTMARAGMTVAGGWQSSLEKHFLQTFMDSGRGYVISYAARMLEDAPLRSGLDVMMDSGRLLQVAPDVAQSRATLKTVARRDALMLEQCHAVLFLFIAPEGRLAELFGYLIEHRFPLFVLHHPLNGPWLRQGALPVAADDIGVFF